MSSRQKPVKSSADLFEVRLASDDPSKGRGAYALKDFKYGDIILNEREAFMAQEKPSDPPLPFLVCEHCLSYVGSLEMQLEIICADLEVDPIPSSTYTSISSHLPKLPPYKSCEDCGAVFCEEKCFDFAVQRYHKRLCPQFLKDQASNQAEAMRKFIDLDTETPNLKLMFGAKLIAMILHEIESNKVDLSQARDTVVGRWRSMPYSVQSTLQRRVIDQSVSDNDIESVLSQEITEQEEAASISFADSVLSPALSLLQQALTSSIQPSMEKVLSMESFDSLLGIVHLNNVEVQVFSPLHRFLRDLEASKVDHSDANTIESTVRLLVAKYGDIPVCSGSGLFSKYAMANHSCCFNAVPRRTREEEVFEKDQCAATLFVATQAIKKGSEITLPYISTRGKRRADRQKELWRKYAFLCKCPCCCCYNPACTSLVGIGAALRCARCKKATYCSAACQKEHWKNHKHACKQ